MECEDKEKSLEKHQGMSITFSFSVFRCASLTREGILEMMKQGLFYVLY